MPHSVADSASFMLAFLVCVVAFVGIVVTTIWGSQQIRRRVEFSEFDTRIVMGLMALAFVLRWWLPDHALIHENRHGYRYAPDALFELLRVPERLTAHEVFSSHIFLQSFTGLWMPPADSVFVLGAILSSLTAGMLYLFGWQLTGSRRVGWAGAVCFVTLPLAIMMGPTEEFLVLTTCCTISGAVFIRAGLRHDAPAATVGGALLIVFGAMAREVTLPISLVVPIVALTSAHDKKSWRWAIGATLLTGLLLLPQFSMLLTAMRGLDERPHYFGSPVMPWSRGWPGWDAPHVSRWIAWAMIVGALTMPVVLWRQGKRRESLAFVGMLVLAQLAGGLVNSGNWPSQSRHELLAITLFTLPVGWLVATSVQRLPRAGVLAMPALGLLPLVLQPTSFRPRCAHIAEYLFLREVLDSLPEGASMVPLESASLSPDLPPLLFIPFGYEKMVRPDLRPRAVEGLLSDSHTENAYFLVDRACFVGAEPKASGMPKAPQTVDDLGAMNPYCTSLLAPARWEIVRSQEITTPPPPHDLQMPQKQIRIALLKYAGPRADGGSQKPVTETK